MKYQFSQTPVHVPRIDTRYRRIKTAIPAPETLSILSALETYEAPSMHGQLPIVSSTDDHHGRDIHRGSEYLQRDGRPGASGLATDVPDCARHVPADS